MKKHILGFALFSLIVGATAIVYALVNVPETIRVVDVAPVSYVRQNDSASKPTSCWNMNRRAEESKSGSPLISQADLNEESGLFIFEIGCSENLKQVFLYFYEKTENAAKLIAVEKIDLKPSINCENKSSLYKNFAWAKEVNPASNIYVIARTSNKNMSASFDESLAVPVLMASGKLSF